MPSLLVRLLMGLLLSTAGSAAGWGPVVHAQVLAVAPTPTRDAEPVPTTEAQPEAAPRTDIGTEPGPAASTDATPPPSAEPPDAQRQRWTGLISFYGKGFAGRRTASGERFDPLALTMAHRTLPFGTLVRITLGERSVTLRVNDRGPWRGKRIADISWAAAQQIGLLRTGVAVGLLEVVANPEDG